MEEKKISMLKQQTAQYAVEHITGKGEHKEINWLRDSFNELCDEMNIPRPQELDNYDRKDVLEALKKDPWVKDIAKKGAGIITKKETKRIVEEFFCKHWMMKPEEVTSKDVTQLLKYVDPYSHRHIVANQIAIECIAKLNYDELHRLDIVLSELEKNPDQETI